MVVKLNIILYHSRLCMQWGVRAANSCFTLSPSQANKSLLMAISKIKWTLEMQSKNIWNVQSNLKSDDE